MTAHHLVTKKSHGAVVNLSVVVLLVVLLVGGVYISQHQKVDDLNSKNNTLASQLAVAQLQKEQALADAATAKEVSTTQPVVYKASAGKFTLTLPGKYVVIVENDGPAEGGPHTALTIGQKTATNGVVTSSGYDPVKVWAAPLVYGETFRGIVNDFVTKDQPYKKSTTRIDGITAETYMVGGIGASKYVYFTKNNTMYRLEYDNGATDTSNPMLDDVIAGFRFN